MRLQLFIYSLFVQEKLNIYDDFFKNSFEDVCLNCAAIKILQQNISVISEC